jgi:ABC-2 type transport system ATP-binding protein
MTVRGGEIYGFLGQNGAGKSTAINCMAGILKPDGGSITLDGFSLSHNPTAYKRLFGYVTDTTNAFERVSGRQYVWHIARLYGEPGDGLNSVIDGFAGRFNLSAAIDREIKTYSNGMKQKINIIAALIHRPKLWLLDEPMTGLDPRSAYSLMEFMRSYAQEGNSVLFSSHILEIVENVCDRVGIIRAGEMLGEYDLKELKAGGKTLGGVYMELTAE